MKPYYQDEAVTMYHGDCREVLPALSSGSVDLVLSDPPYGIGSRSLRRAGPEHQKARFAPMQGDDSLTALADAMPHVDRLLRPDRHAYLFASPARIGQAIDLTNAFWRVKNVLVWDKGNAGTKGDLKAGYGVNWEAIVYANKGRRSLNGPRPRCIYRYDWSANRDPVHPTVKPVGLLQWLIGKSADEGEVVLDPFMGSGTTLRAAKDLHRRAIGVEVEERYCETAARRMAEGVT